MPGEMVRYVVLQAVCFMLVLQSMNMSVMAFVFRVRGKNGWAVPAGSDTETYGQWAQRNRFQVGDYLLFQYKPGQDSVLRVSEEDYNTCNTARPLQFSNNGNSVFRFPSSGAFYFISGVPGNCQKGEKIVVVVMGERDISRGWHAPGPGQSPGPSPSPSSSSPVNIAPSPSMFGPPPLVPGSIPTMAPSPVSTSPPAPPMAAPYTMPPSPMATGPSPTNVPGVSSPPQQGSISTPPSHAPSTTNSTGAASSPVHAIAASGTVIVMWTVLSILL